MRVLGIFLIGLLQLPLFAMITKFSAKHVPQSLYYLQSSQIDRGVRNYHVYSRLINRIMLLTDPKGYRKVFPKGFRACSQINAEEAFLCFSDTPFPMLH